MRSKGGRSSLMHQDYKDLLSAFQSHGVRYLVVGGFAVIYHSQPRFTKNMDLFIQAFLAAKIAWAAYKVANAPTASNKAYRTASFQKPALEIGWALNCA